MKTIIEMPKPDGMDVDGLCYYTADQMREYAALVRADAREKSLKLWMLLDDIDTADDIAKTDHDTYRKLCRNIQQKRWAVLNTSEVDAAIRARGNT